MNQPEQDKQCGNIAPAANSGTVNIIIADDHDFMRQELVDLLKNQKGFKVVAQAANGKEAVQTATALKPDVVLMDFSMPEINGIDATMYIRDQLPDTCVIGMSVSNDTFTRRSMLEAGACAYLIKSDLPAIIFKTIRNVHQNEKQ